MIKVLLADDEEKVCQLIYHLVDWEEKNMKVCGIAHNGIEALEIVERECPDIVITDIRMPGIDGLELIKKVKEKKDDIDCIIISGYSEFDYAQKAIRYGVEDYLLKPINKEELSECLDKIKNNYKVKSGLFTEEEKRQKENDREVQNLRTHFLNELLSNNKDWDRTIEEVNTMYYYHFSQDHFQFVTIKFDIKNKENYGNGISVLKNKALQMIENHLGEYCIDYDTFLDDNRIYCILNYKEENKKVIRKNIKTILDEIIILKELFGDFKVTIGNGCIINDIKDLKKSYDYSNVAVNERMTMGVDRIIENVENVVNMDNIHSILRILNKKIDGILEVLDKNEFANVVRYLKMNLVVEYHLNCTEIMICMRELYNIFVVLLRKYGYEGYYQYDKNTFLYSIDQCSSISDIFTYFNEYFQQWIDEIIKHKKEEKIKPIRIAKQYINENYMHSITLEDISAVVGFNSSYFSTLFKKESGKNFLEYISEVRMEKAKELLKETDLNIAVICEKVGYSDLKYFTKNFKKNAGISPNQYRKLYS